MNKLQDVNGQEGFWRKRAVAGSLAAIGALLLFSNWSVTVPIARAEVDQVTCQTYTLAVALSDGGPTSAQVSGDLCATGAERQNGQTIQVLLHGITYNHGYWDFGFQNAYYSYARHVAAGGYATFAYDRIGAGASTRPPSIAVDQNMGAFVAHQVITTLKSGALTGTQFGKVIPVGHSFGSDIAWQEVTSYPNDVAGLIVTGALHHVNPAFLQVAFTDLYPANRDPLFRTANLDDGYLTTLPGTRSALFYNPADADPGVIDYDEAHKDVASFLEIQDAGLAPGNATLTNSIKVPVLLIQGTNDFLFCDATNPCSSSTALLQQELPFYASSVCLQAVTVPYAGHDISLHLNHWIQELASISWSDRFIGRTASYQAPGGCP